MKKRGKQEGMRWIDRLNPVVLFEARQITRNNITVATNVMLLTAMLSVIILHMFFSPLHSGHSLGIRQYLEDGRGIFTVGSLILCIATFGIVPVFTGARLHFDRNNFPLMFTTPLPPAAFLRGKILSAATLTLLNIALCAPFMVFAFMLRGVDYVMIASFLGVLFLATLLASEFFLLIACLPLGIEQKVMTAIFSLMLCFSLLKEQLYISSGFVGFPLRTWFILVRVLLAFTAILFFHQCSRALLTPKTANRALPFRLWTTGLLVFWATCIPALFYFFFGKNPTKFFVRALYAVTIMVPISLRGAISPNLRLRDKIPKTILWRRLAFPWFNGSANALVWLALLSVPLLLALFLLGTATIISTREAQEITSVALYTWGFGQMAVYLHFLLCRISKRNIMQEGIWILFALIWGAAYGIPRILPASWVPSHYHLFLRDSLLPICGWNPDVHIAIAGLVFLIFFALNLPSWWLPQFKAFRPLPTEKHA